MISFSCKSFQDLSTNELYAILWLRAKVFVVEQNCPYQDLDGKDQKSYHVLGIADNMISAYTRVIPKGVSYQNYSSIGRVVCDPSVRGKGSGKALMQFSIESCKELFPNDPIKISAQSYLRGFYMELGFTQTGEEYLEDNIPHIAMILDKSIL